MNVLRRVPTIKSRIIPWTIDRQFRRIAKGLQPIIAGPWLSEVGFELLYWIPFLNWATARYGLSKDRIIVISRGGAELWYKDICDRYLDVLDYSTAEEFRIRNLQRITEAGGQKHMAISSFDREIIQVAQETLTGDKVKLLHPSLMYRLFMLYWEGHTSMRLLERHTRYQELRPVARDEMDTWLPDDYIAVKFYFSPCFPDTEQNRTFISNLLGELSRKTHVVLLNTPAYLDEHRDSDTVVKERIHAAAHLMNSRNNLEIQTKIVARARAFCGTYGGFSYLAPFYGVPSIAFYSVEGGFLPVHLDVARRAFSSIKRASFIVLNVRDVDAVRLILDQEAMCHDRFV